jgi:hypothetical protein
VANNNALLPPVEHERNGSVDVVLGIQWGDEGKGRVVDLLAKDYAIVARFGGGDNAGHSIEVGAQKLALRIVPSGALVPSAKLHIGTGTVVSLNGLLTELDALAKIGVDISRITISDRAHIVFPYHATLDAAAERARGGAALGTTGRGIGPAYIDRVGRTGDPGRQDSPGDALEVAALRRDRRRAGRGRRHRRDVGGGRTGPAARGRRRCLYQRSARAR